MRFNLSKHKNGIMILCDLLIVVVSFFATIFITKRIPKTSEEGLSYIYSLALLVITYFFMMYGFDIYKSLWRYAQTTEFVICTMASFAGGFIFFLGDRVLIIENVVEKPIYFYILLTCIITLAMLTIRICYRMYKSKVKIKVNRKRALLIGAGSAGASLIVYTKESAKASYEFVAAIDDDETKIGKRLYGINIVGKTNEIEEYCEKYAVELIVIAIPSATGQRRAEIIDNCLKTNCVVRTLPNLEDLDDASNGSLSSHIRDITPEELLGRDSITIVNEKIFSFIEGKVVAITGGGGSIGSELCRQIAKHNPKALIIIDIYENNAYDIQQELLYKYKGRLNLFVYIASVREYETINSIFRKHKPNLVFHAAAHKHVPLMEVSPKEAVKNNIFGTRNTIRAAINNDVSKFVLISTDKAVNPTNIMGATKRICEKIAMSQNGKSRTQCIAVRFGNVLGSNGSVIPLFKKQIENGGPVTVTHPDIIRYFMTIPEASQLVITAAAMAKGGEIFVLDMGDPIKINDLAKNMIKLSGLVLGKDIEIEYTGLRPGEKLYEELLLSTEGTKTTENKKIFIGKQQEVDEIGLDILLEKLSNCVYDCNSSDEKVEQIIKEIVPSFKRLVLIDKEYIYEK